MVGEAGADGAGHDRVVTDGRPGGRAGAGQGDPGEGVGAGQADLAELGPREGDRGAVGLGPVIGGDREGPGRDGQGAIDVADVVVAEAGADRGAGHDRVVAHGRPGGRAGAGQGDPGEGVGAGQADLAELGPREGDRAAVGLGPVIGADRERAARDRLGVGVRRASGEARNGCRKDRSDGVTAHGEGRDRQRSLAARERTGAKAASAVEELDRAGRGASSWTDDGHGRREVHGGAVAGWIHVTGHGRRRRAGPDDHDVLVGTERVQSARDGQIKNGVVRDVPDRSTVERQGSRRHIVEIE